MTELPAAPWIHIGDCPVCVNGLCRVRTCLSRDGQPHFYAMCDECESLWLVPNTDSTRSFPDAVEPRCPVCQQALYGPQAHWSLAEELTGTEWLTNAIFDVPNLDAVDDDLSDEPIDP